MTGLEILTAFELEIGMIDNELEKPATDDSLYWINQAIARFVKTRFNGDAVHNTGYEQTEKRRNDLDGLFVQKDLNVINADSNSDYTRYKVTYPTNFLYALNEDVEIKIKDKTKHVSVFECTQDSFMYRIMNSLTDFHLYNKNARPIRTRTSDGCYLYTDGKYSINKYTLGYIKEPEKIILGTSKQFNEFDTSTWYEIIKIAAQMFLENTKNERYKTITQEVLTQE